MSALAQVDRQELTKALDAALLSGALEACADGLAIVSKGRVLYANPAFGRLVHKSNRQQLQGQDLSELLPDYELDAGREEKDRVQSGVDIRCASFHAGGSEFQIVSLHDITEQRRIEQKLQDAHRLGALGRLVGGVAHDFNNLLTAIMLYSDLLAAGLTRERRLRHHAEEIRMAGEQGAALVRQLMAVAKPHAVVLHSVSLNETVCAMKGILSRLIGENIELDILLAEDLGAVRTDPAQMQQVILNLVLNARDAMPEGGRISLQTRNCMRAASAGDQIAQLAACVELSVSDTGCGMDAETKSHLFEPFFTTKRPGRGNGLGLATVESIVKQDGGTIQVESEVGKGTRVSVFLPQAGQNLPFDLNTGVR